MPSIHLERLVKRYGEVEVLHGIELDMADNEFTVWSGRRAAVSRPRCG
jgi:multiple sugar transport system ATP-binding protein